MGLAQRASHHGKVLGKDIDQTAVNGAVAGHHAVAVDPLLFQPEVLTAVLGQWIEFHKTVGIQQRLDPLTGCELPVGVLAVDGLLAAAQQQCLLALLQFL